MFRQRQASQQVCILLSTLFSSAGNGLPHRLHSGFIIRGGVMVLIESRRTNFSSRAFGDYFPQGSGDLIGHSVFSLRILVVLRFNFNASLVAFQVVNDDDEFYHGFTHLKSQAPPLRSFTIANFAHRNRRAATFIFIKASSRWNPLTSMKMMPSVSG